MKIVTCFLLLFAVVSCESKDGGDRPAVNHESSDVLSPKDLNIRKERFTARPGPEQVAIFRVEKFDRLKPTYSMIYDQIFWGKESDDVIVDVVIAPLSFYIGRPEATRGDEETFFRDSWNLSAGIYTYDIEEYSFVKSSFGSGHKWLKVKGLGLEAGVESSFAEGNIVYTKHSKTKSKDLEFKFTMFVLSLEDAKKMHPQLDIEPDEHETSWSAAFMLEQGSSVLKEDT